MKCNLKTLLLLISLTTFCLWQVKLWPKEFIISAQTQEEKLQQLNDEITKYENELKKLSVQKDTLSNQIAQYDAQIKLTTLKISQTEEQISLLGGRIDQLQISLTSLIEAFNQRANETYKMSRFSEPYLLVISSHSLSDMVTSFHYLKRIQEADRSLSERLRGVQNNYLKQKSDQEILQSQLEVQKAQLAAQKTAKGRLLDQTKNDEKRYQQLLAQARSEFEAIQAIIAGKGQEELVGKVSEGQKIATMIQGASCNSSGTHLHFLVAQNNAALNPFNYLRSGVSYENCSTSSCGAANSDPFNPSGSWNWPINEKISFYQGFGSTWAVRNTWVGRVYSSHNGIDIGSDSPDVKAVKSGTLYRGSYAGGGGCRLRYVRIDHDDSDLDTYYLHVNY